MMEKGTGGCVFAEWPLLADAALAEMVRGSLGDCFFPSGGKWVLNGELVSGKAFSKLLEDGVWKKLNELKAAFGDGTWTVVADSGSERRSGWELVEEDVDFGLRRFEKTAEKLFNKLMKENHRDPNVLFCKHEKLVSSDWAEICRKRVFGRRNVKLSEFCSELGRRAEAVRSVEQRSEPKRELLKAGSLVADECAGWILAKMCESCSSSVQLQSKLAIEHSAL